MLCHYFPYCFVIDMPNEKIVIWWISIFRVCERVNIVWMKTKQLISNLQFICDNLRLWSSWERAFLISMQMYRCVVSLPTNIRYGNQGSIHIHACTRKYYNKSLRIITHSTLETLLLILTLFGRYRVYCWYYFLTTKRFNNKTVYLLNNLQLIKCDNLTRFIVANHSSSDQLLKMYA